MLIDNALYQNCTTCKGKNTSLCYNCTSCDIQTQLVKKGEMIGQATIRLNEEIRKTRGEARKAHGAVARLVFILRGGK